MVKRALGIIFAVAVAAGICGQGFRVNAFAQQQAATRAREVGATPAAEVTVTLNEQFFNSLLDVIFSRLRAPSYPLSLTRSATDHQVPGAGSTTEMLAHSAPTQGSCDSVVTLQREIDGVKTSVRFQDGKIVAPLAFTGSYGVALIGCVNFQGSANTVINLDFDRQRQILSARVTVLDIRLSNVPSLASGVVVRLVQNSIDRRINPIEILPAAQLSARIPVAGSGGALRMRATEIRPEVVPGALSLRIFYEFSPAD